MEDITKPKIPPTPIKEHCISILIANIPGSITVALLRVLLDINGVILPLILIFGGAIYVEKLRKEKGKIATSKTVWFWLFINILVFLILPMIFISIL